MIEKTVLDYLNENLDVSVFMSRPQSEEIPDSYCLLEKAGSSVRNHIYTATFMIQSIAPTLYQAAVLNDAVKSAMDGLINLNEVTRSTLNSDYNFTDPKSKEFRYQCVYDVVHY